jgi:hypothetical protein
VARTTVHEYFEILRDTLVLHELPAWRRGRKRKPIASSKYYFFDVGVTTPPGAYLSPMVADAAGNLWAGSGNLGLLRWDGTD